MNLKTAVSQSCISREFFSLGTMNSICIYDCFDNWLLEEAIKTVTGIDDKMSVFKPESEVSCINKNAGQASTVIGDGTFSVLKAAKDMSDLSAGAFDITVRPLVKLWGIGVKQNFIPNKQQIDSVLNLVNYKDIVLNDTVHSVYLKKTGQSIDLGGIAKGYAADKIKCLLVENGVKNALINFGGNIVTIGCNPEGRPWRIGVQNPASVRGEALGTVSISDKTVVSSGINERFFIKNGVRYHHIIDPQTGFPADSGLLSVTVIADSSLEADALTTALLVLGMEKGSDLIKNYRADVIFATDDGKIYMTEGLFANFSIKN